MFQFSQATLDLDANLSKIAQRHPSFPPYDSINRCYGEPLYSLQRRAALFCRDEAKDCGSSE
jgi:hypothetical protein